MGGAGEHAIFGGDPALAPAAEEGRDLVLDARGAQHARVAEADEARTFGMAGEAGLETKLTHLIGGASGRAHDVPFVVYSRALATFVIPAKAGTQFFLSRWVPGFRGDDDEEQADYMKPVTQPISELT